jgi:hypothetical protein
MTKKYLKKFIESPNKNDFDPTEFPAIRKQFSLDDIKTATLNLDKVIVFFFG